MKKTRDYESILIINDQEGQWDLSVFIQSTHGPKPRVSTPAQHLEVDLCKIDKDDVYETQGVYMPAKATDDNFWGENK